MPILHSLRWKPAFVLAALGLCLLPPSGRADSWNWADADGKNYMSPLRGPTAGNCRTRAGVAACEAKIKIVLDRPNLEIDLSERHAYYAAKNWSGFQQFSGKTGKGMGLLTEAEMPTYMDPLVFAEDWEQRAYSITDFEAAIIYDERALRGRIQQWIRQYGPLYVVNYAGYTLIGYDDQTQQWIFRGRTSYPDDPGYWSCDYGFLDGTRIEMLTGDVYYLSLIHI